MKFYLAIPVILAVIRPVHGVASLPALNVDPNAISVSGISSGAAMATQFHVAFSSEIMGVGMIAGVPYLCFPATPCLKTPGQVNVGTLQAQTASAVMSQAIDSTDNMKDDNIWIFAGSEDTVVNPGASNKTRDFYSIYVDNSDQIKIVDNIPAAHGQPTNNYGGPCGNFSAESKYLNNCNYSAAYHLLNFIYGSLQEPSASYIATGELYQFDQSQFTDSSALMDTIGYVYVPTGCQVGIKAFQSGPQMSAVHRMMDHMRGQ